MTMFGARPPARRGSSVISYLRGWRAGGAQERERERAAGSGPAAAVAALHDPDRVGGVRVEGERALVADAHVVREHVDEVDVADLVGAVDALDDAGVREVRVRVGVAEDDLVEFA